MTIKDFCNENGHGPGPGSEIRVLAHSYYRKTNLMNLCGTIVDCDASIKLYGKVQVKIEGRDNPRSASGYFYFKPEELEILDNNMEEQSMNNITNYLNTAKIQYLDNTTPSHHDYANFDPELKEGDICVVLSAHHGFGLARVVEIQDRNDADLQREIAARVDTTAYNERVRVREEMAELKTKMKERAKKLQDVALYQMLAKEDPEMAKLLTRFKNLTEM